VACHRSGQHEPKKAVLGSVFWSFLIQCNSSLQLLLRQPRARSVFVARPRWRRRRSAFFSLLGLPARPDTENRSDEYSLSIVTDFFWDAVQHSSCTQTPIGTQPVNVYYSNRFRVTTSVGGHAPRLCDSESIDAEDCVLLEEAKLQAMELARKQQ